MASPKVKVQTLGEMRPSKVMQSCLPSPSGVLGHPTCSKIAWAATHNVAYGADARGDQATVGQLADPHGKVDVLFNQIHNPVGKHHTDVNFGVGLQKFYYDWQNMKASEHDRGGDDEIAFRDTIFPRSGALDLAHQLKDLLAICYVGAPCIGQCQATARPVHQSRFEMRLQLGDFAAHIGEWNTETAGCG